MHAESVRVHCGCRVCIRLYMSVDTSLSTSERVARDGPDVSVEPHAFFNGNGDVYQIPLYCAETPGYERSKTSEW